MYGVEHTFCTYTVNFWDSYDVFWNFYFNNFVKKCKIEYQKKKEKKSNPSFQKTLGQSEKSKQTSFFRPKVYILQVIGSTIWDARVPLVYCYEFNWNNVASEFKQSMILLSGSHCKSILVFKYIDTATSQSKARTSLKAAIFFISVHYTQMYSCLVLNSVQLIHLRFRIKYVSGKCGRTIMSFFPLLFCQARI